MDKKITKDEAEAKAKEVHGYIENETYMTTEGDSFVLYFPGSATIIARFPFEPPHPEKGTTCKFSNSDNDDWCIGQLKNHNLNPTHANHFQASNGWWYGECIPFELIDPGDHAKLSENFDELLVQHKEVCAECDKAKQTEAVLAELLPVCKNITEMVRNRWSMSEIVYTAKQLEELLK